MISPDQRHTERFSKTLEQASNTLLDARILHGGTIESDLFEARLNLLISAVRHELSNEIFILHEVLDQNKPEQFTQIVKGLSRLFALAEIVQLRGFPDNEKLKSRFSASEQKMIELGSGDNFPDIGSPFVRNLIRAEAHFLRQKLEELPLESIMRLNEKEQNRLERLLSFQKPLLDCLISLTEGQLEINAPLFLHSLSLEKKQLLIGLSCAAMGYPIEVVHPGVDLDEIMLDTHPIVSILIFGNLISNAAEALRAAGRSEAIRFEINLSGNFVSFACLDQGCGMSAAIRKKLNAGIGTSSKLDSANHGIGFPYARELARQAGGDLKIAWSRPGKGTRVELLLPRIPG